MKCPRCDNFVVAVDKDDYHKRVSAFDKSMIPLCTGCNRRVSECSC